MQRFQIEIAKQTTCTTDDGQYTNIDIDPRVQNALQNIMLIKMMSLCNKKVCQFSEEKVYQPDYYNAQSLVLDVPLC